jgi:hypothetical protein
LQEETVDDHYAALVAEQRRQPSRVAPPTVAGPASQSTEREALEREPASPEETIDALLTVVSDALDDEETDAADAAVPLPRRAEREPVRYHSIEDYLQSARQDAVRMDRHEPYSPPAALPAADRRDSREPDLYARLRRLRGDS